jgi:hypothetical protein
MAILLEMKWYSVMHRDSVYIDRDILHLLIRETNNLLPREFALSLIGRHP